MDPAAVSSEPVTPAPRQRRPTATSSFGVSRREAHDASAFYERFPAPVLSDDDAVAPPVVLDRIFCGDARDMDATGDIADGSVALVVTSPPYFAGKDYETELGQGGVPASYTDYLAMLGEVFAECVRKLEPGGRIAVNVANLGRKPYRSLSADVIDIFQRLGLLLRGEIIWRKAATPNGSCAWGSYQRPHNPVLRDTTERIVVASKGRFDRARTARARQGSGLPHVGTISRDEFMDATGDVWEFPPESATRVGHPAPFPLELPRRLIELYTYRDDLVLDPFMGSGSTAVAALEAGRHWVGFDTDEGYVAATEARIAAAAKELSNETDRIEVLPGRLPAEDAPDAAAPEELADFQARGVREGHKARAMALGALRVAGFTDIAGDPRFPRFGVTGTFRALDQEGRPWLFDVSGTFSTTQPGLRRSEVLWKALGRALALSAAREEAERKEAPEVGRLVLLTTDVPEPASAGAKALAQVTGDGEAVAAVIEFSSQAGLDQLAALAQGDKPGG